MNEDIKNKFIVDDSLKSDRLEELAQRVLKWAKITKKGEIIMENDKLSSDDKLRLALVTRCIAHQFSEEIPGVVTLSELKNLINETTQATGSRMSRLEKKQKFAYKVKYGVYAVREHRIERFIDELETKKFYDRGKQ